MLLGAVADPAVLVAAEIQAEEQAVARRERGVRDGRVAAGQDRLAGMQRSDLVVGELGGPGEKAQLVEGQALAHLDGERQGDDLEEEPPPVAGRDLVEAVAVVGDHAREHVEAPGRALRVRLPPDAGRQLELLDERDQIGALRLEDGAVSAQVDLVDDEVLELDLDGRIVGEEAAADPVRDLAEMQVEAGRLDARSPDLVPAGVDDALVDRSPQVLAGEDTPGVGAQAERIRRRHRRGRRRRRLIHPCSSDQRTGSPS